AQQRAEDEQRDGEQAEQRDRHRRDEVGRGLARADGALLEAQRGAHGVRSTVTRPELLRAWIANGAPASTVTPRISGEPPAPEVDAATRARPAGPAACTA